MKKNKLFSITICVSLFILLAVFYRPIMAIDNNIETDATQSEHDEHDEDTEETGLDLHDEHDEHDHSEAITLDSHSVENIEIHTATAEYGDLTKTISLTGEVRINQNKQAIIMPLISGKVKTVNHNIGDKVKKGEILTWLESIKLAEIKGRYLELKTEVGCCQTVLDRAQSVHDNTLTLINSLKTEPTLDEISKLETNEAGENLGTLIKAYTEYKLTNSVLQREKKLANSNISSQQEYIAAENAYNSARANYLALLNSTEYKVKQDLLEAIADSKRINIALKGTESILYTSGLLPEDLSALDSLITNSEFNNHKGQCTDPNCDQCLEHNDIEKNEENDSFSKLGWYPLRAGFDSTIIARNITLGQRVNEDDIAFTIADLSSLWVDLDVFAKDIENITVGQKCQIFFENNSFEGIISYLSPVLDPTTRTATARVVFDNSSSQLKAGYFVSAKILTSGQSNSIIVPKSAVVIIDNETCVFVQEDDIFEQRLVTVGSSNSTHTEILSGLQADEIIVTKGAFELKAKIVTSTLDSHAGHGH